jgi:murein DD-endopeptidase MepM/ murein hydrolase activator NlpD
MTRKLARLGLLVLFLWSIPMTGLAAPGYSASGQSAVPPEEIIHVVQPGETLFRIAERYGSSVPALAHANGLTDPTRIYAGQELRIPGASSGRLAARLTSYVVQPGDSLSWIARRHAATWHELARANGLVSPGVVQAGQVLQVPVRDWKQGTLGGLHVVGVGETLYRIALRYDVSPSALVAANDWHPSGLLHPGMPLLVPGDGVGRLPSPFETVDVHSLPAEPGESLVITVRTREAVRLSGTVFERPIRFAELDGVYYGLVGVHVFTDPGLFQATLTAETADGDATEITVDVVVEGGGFGYERIPAAPSLLDPEVVAAEKARLDGLRPTFTPERSWTGGFEPPCPGTISSYFGTRRAYNDGPYTSYHGGVDFRGATGTPVRAPAAGRVVLTDVFAVRGNALVLDHGWGVLTGYWHLSSMDVEVGEWVEQGEVIARVGNTGLSTGSHLHWEMWVGGVNVNPIQWLDAFYPWPEHGDAADHGELP